MLNFLVGLLLLRLTSVLFGFGGRKLVLGSSFSPLEYVLEDSKYVDWIMLCGLGMEASNTGSRDAAGKVGNGNGTGN